MMQNGQPPKPRPVMRDPIPALLSADEAYAYRERLAILCGESREPTEWERDLAQSDAMALRAAQRGELF